MEVVVAEEIWAPLLDLPLAEVELVGLRLEDLDLQTLEAVVEVEVMVQIMEEQVDLE
tara:strand:+ start:473 stop:643 length:171 start_codon:yes stop_codon:yes gene_type:complete